MSAAARRLPLHLCPSAGHSPICVPLPTTFITGVIDQLIYWWLQEVQKAVVLLLPIIAGCFYGALIAPYCLLVVNKRHSKGCFAPPGGCVFFAALPVCLAQAFLKAGFLSDAHGGGSACDMAANPRPHLWNPTSETIPTLTSITVYRKTGCSSSKIVVMAFSHGEFFKTSPHVGVTRLGFH